MLFNHLVCLVFITQLLGFIYHQRYIGCFEGVFWGKTGGKTPFCLYGSNHLNLSSNGHVPNFLVFSVRSPSQACHHDGKEESLWRGSISFAVNSWMIFLKLALPQEQLKCGYPFKQFTTGKTKLYKVQDLICKAGPGDQKWIYTCHVLQSPSSAFPAVRK